MDSILQQLLGQPALVLATATLGGILFFLVLETLWPRRPGDGGSVWRLSNNLSLACLNFAATLALSYLLAASGWLQRFALFGGLGELGPAASFCILFLVLEAFMYAIHRLYHSVPLLWRLHAVHHCDTELDATTSHRHHTLEVLINTALLAPILVLLAPDPAIFLLVALTRLGIGIFSHSNLKVPRFVDRCLRWVLVTPDFHRLHHRSQRTFTDSNYSASLSVFDHLFGTATDAGYDQHEHFELGLEYLRAPADSRPDRLLALPFRREPFMAQTERASL